MGGLIKGYKEPYSPLASYIISLALKRKEVAIILVHANAKKRARVSLPR
jgi:hypothetical protein